MLLKRFPIVKRAMVSIADMLSDEWQLEGAGITTMFDDEYEKILNRTWTQ